MDPQNTNQDKPPTVGSADIPNTITNNQPINNQVNIPEQNPYIGSVTPPPNQSATNNIAESQPTIQHQPVFKPTSYVGGSMEPELTTKTKNIFNSQGYIPNNNKKKKLIFGGVISTVVVLAIFAYIFFWFVPNRPQNVWSNGMSRTGKEIDALIQKINDPESFKALEKNKVSIKGTAKFNDGSLNLNIDSKFDKDNTNNTINVSGTGADKSYNVNAEIKTKLIDDLSFPNIYFKIVGLSSLSSEIPPEISKYENKWISVEQDFYKEFLNGQENQQQNKNITQQDVMNIVKDLVLVSKQYAFSSDPKKAIFVNKEFIATEESEGIKANHYIAGINKVNLKSYCEATVNKVVNNQSYKKIFADQASSDAKKDALKTCDNVKNIEDDFSFDLWIDKKYKLFHKARFYTDFDKIAKKQVEDKNKCLQEERLHSQYYEDSVSYCNFYDDKPEKGQQYSEFGQIYKSGDDITVFIHYKSDTNITKSDTRVDLSINLEKLLLNGKLAVNDETSKTKVDITVTSEPYKGEIDTEKPKDAIPLKQIWTEIVPATSSL